jgi:hypothetical protein
VFGQIVDGSFKRQVATRPKAFATSEVIVARHLGAARPKRGSTERYCCNPEIPARAHSSSCSLEGALSTPHAPSTFHSWIIGSPPRTRMAGMPSPTTRPTLESFQTPVTSPLGRPERAETTAFPTEPCMAYSRVPSIRLSAIKCPTWSHTATLTLMLSCRALAIAAFILRLASARLNGISMRQVGVP